MHNSIADKNGLFEENHPLDDQLSVRDNGTPDILDFFRTFFRNDPPFSLL